MSQNTLQHKGRNARAEGTALVEKLSGGETAGIRLGGSDGAAGEERAADDGVGAPGLPLDLGDDAVLLRVGGSLDPGHAGCPEQLWLGGRHLVVGDAVGGDEDGAFGIVGDEEELHWVTVVLVLRLMPDQTRMGSLREWAGQPGQVPSNYSDHVWETFFFQTIGNASN